MTDKVVEKIVVVLNDWSGTHEQLGADLYDAVQPIDTQLGMGARQRAIEKQSGARKRILACEGGQELLEAEEERIKES